METESRDPTSRRESQSRSMLAKQTKRCDSMNAGHDLFLILTSLLKILGIVFRRHPADGFLQRLRGAAGQRADPGSARTESRRDRLGFFSRSPTPSKFLLKEDFTPAHVNTFYYWLAPCLAMVPAIMTIAVVPFGSTLLGVPMVIADINVGVLYVFAIASLGVYGIVHRRLVLEFEISVSRRSSLDFADDLLRAFVRAWPSSRFSSSSASFA